MYQTVTWAGLLWAPAGGREGPCFPYLHRSLIYESLVSINRLVKNAPSALKVHVKSHFVASAAGSFAAQSLWMLFAAWGWEPRVLAVYRDGAGEGRRKNNDVSGRKDGQRMNREIPWCYLNLHVTYLFITLSTDWWWRILVKFLQFLFEISVQNVLLLCIFDQRLTWDKWSSQEML